MTIFFTISALINIILFVCLIVIKDDYNIMRALREQALSRNEELCNQRDHLQFKLTKIKEILK